MEESLTNLVKCIAEVMPEIPAPLCSVWSNQLEKNIGISSDVVFNLSQVLKFIAQSNSACLILLANQQYQDVVRACYSLLTSDDTGDAQKGSNILISLIKNCQEHLEPYKA